MTGSAVRPLSEHRVSLERDVFYYPNFVTAEEEQYIIRKINDSPQPRWKQLPNRRLQIWGGEITAKGNLVAQALPSFITEFPDVVARIRATGAFNCSPHQAPNHVIMNEYLPGQGIMPHEDGPQYFPVVATLSLGSHAVFHYYKYQSEAVEVSASDGHGKVIDTRPMLSVLLEPRSLIISSGRMYTSHLHGIDSVEEDLFACPQRPAGICIANLDKLEDPFIKECVGSGTALKRGMRYSLTCRDVARVSRLASLR